MGIPQSDILDTELDDGWLTLTMRDPARRNALSEGMVDALSTTLGAVATDRNVRGITLKGSGGIFCSGGDLKGMGARIMAGDREAIVAMSERAGQLFTQINEQPQFVMAAIDGPAMAGGLGLACCADLVAVTATARFALTETRLGIPPAQITPFVVARIGVPAARRLILTGSSFDGHEAGNIGLADHVAADPVSLERFESDVRQAVLQAAPEALAASKRIILESGQGAPAALMRGAAEAFADCLLSDEGREGIASFVEKRKPRWAIHD